MSEVPWTPEQQARYESIKAEWKVDQEKLRAGSIESSEMKVISLQGSAERLKAARAKAEEEMSWPTSEVPKTVSFEVGSNEDGVNAGRQRSFLTELNGRHAVLNNVGGKCLVADWVPNPIDKLTKVLSLQSFDCIEKRYSNRFLSDGNNRKALGKWWLAHKERRTYEGLVLVPDGPEVINGCLNLWRGWGVNPRPGDWSLMRRHIEEVLAGGDPLAARYILHYAAWCVQYPDERAEVALVFYGGKGTGKGTFAVALKKCFGQHGLHISSSEHLMGRFNAQFRDCMLLFADEAFWAGDRKGESALKRMVTEPTLFIEQKGIDPYEWKNRLKVIIAGNDEWVVPASYDERRYAVFEVSSARVGDRDYFKALYRQLEAGGLAAMLHDLRSVKLGEWHPREIYRTAALMGQKRRSLGPTDEYFEMLLQNGMLPGALTDRPDTSLSRSLLDDAQRRVPLMRHVGETKLGQSLRERHGCKKYSNGKQRGWTFPPVLEARAAWEKKYGPWPWDNEIREWVAPRTAEELLKTPVGEISGP